MTNAADILAANLKRFRLARSLTQDAFADKLGVSRVSVVGYEAGEVWPRSDVVTSMCRILKVRLSQLFAEEGEGAGVPPDVVDHVAAAARACGLKVSKAGG